MKIISSIKEHKIRFFIFAIAISAIGYWGIKSLSTDAAQILYSLSTVEKGTITSSISGSGQVSTVQQIDLKAKASGEITKVSVISGQEVKAGDIIAQINSKEALKTIRDAEINLESAELSLEKLKQPTDQNSIDQAENSLKNAKDSLEKLKLSQEISYQKALEAKQKAEDNIKKGYEDAYNTIANTFLDLPTIITEVQDILYSGEISESEPIQVGVGFLNIHALLNSTPEDYKLSLTNFQITAENDYESARKKFDTNNTNYNNSNRYSDHENIQKLLDETLETTKAIAQTAKSETNYLDKYVDIKKIFNTSVYAKVTEYQNDLGNHINNTNSHISALLSAQRSLTDYEEALLNADRDLKEMDQNNPLNIASQEAAIREKEAALEDLKDGADSIEIRSQELSIRQRQNSLADAREKLADYIVKAPFDGVMASVDVKKDDEVSSGGTIGTIITKQRTAEISLNEVDVAKVKTEQKAILTFDAIEDLSITGNVAEIDTIGTVNQGIVTYNVKIIFDTQDERVKPGMSVNADIITEMKTDILIVPNGAIKTQGEVSYVEMLDHTIPSDEPLTNISSSTLPQQVEITTGVANDSYTEILTGLSEGDQIIEKTTTSSSTASANKTSNTSSLFSTKGMGQMSGMGGPPQ